MIAGMAHFAAAPLLAGLGILAAFPTQGDELTLRADGTVVSASAALRIEPAYIRDANGDGVLHVTGSDVTIDLGSQRLHGAPPDASPDGYSGVGLVVTGRNVTIRGGRISGYKVGILAIEADGLVLDGVDVSDNFRQRLRSTPAAEDGADWLWPHRNDQQEWRKNYGAGICVERSRNVTIRNSRARDGQNGIVLDRVTDSRIYDNDFSFLSGWGLALWRSSRNTITRNAFDFCVRGYSHGVYNRGQDSAGILMFEQCCENLIAENSATHGGDGFFGFAGREALGEEWLEQERQRLRKETGRQDVDELISAPDDVVAEHRRLGNRDNLLIGNDFSYAPAHGVEMTFSFGTRIIGNRMVENAICGVWGGYSQDTLIAGNTFEGNGEMAYGLERGGVNIEHGRRNQVIFNAFRGNKCGVHLWWDDDRGLLRTPWALANYPAGGRGEDLIEPPAVVASNTFDGDRLALHVRDLKGVVFAANRLSGVDRETEVTPGCEPATVIADVGFAPPKYEALGDSRPVGRRPELRGRDKLIIAEWGPYDWQRPYLQFLGTEWSAAEQRVFHVHRLLGTERIKSTDVAGLRCNLEVGKRDDGTTKIRIAPVERNRVWTYSFTVTTESGVLTAAGTLVDCTWRVRAFAYQTDPRQDVDAWHREAEAAVEFSTHELNLKYGGGGPSDLPGVDANVREARLPRERFGTIAETRLRVPAGKWRVLTTSDDGVRVWVDEQRVIDNWTWHGPTRDTGEFTLAEEREVTIRVEHFELDGYAILQLELAPAAP